MSSQPSLSPTYSVLSAFEDPNFAFAWNLHEHYMIGDGGDSLIGVLKVRSIGVLPARFSAFVAVNL
jgi:hypothetical protein